MLARLNIYYCTRDETDLILLGASIVTNNSEAITSLFVHTLKNITHLLFTFKYEKFLQQNCTLYVDDTLLMHLSPQVALRRSLTLVLRVLFRSGSTPLEY